MIKEALYPLRLGNLDKSILSMLREKTYSLDLENQRIFQLEYLLLLEVVTVILKLLKKITALWLINLNLIKT